MLSNYHKLVASVDFEKILRELEWQFSKSSGPGGQHVNTTDSKAKLIWHFSSSQALRPRQIYLIKKNLGNYLNKSKTHLQFSCSQHRSKERNKQDCIKRLKDLLKNKAFFEPKKRKATSPTRASIKKRLESKKRHSQVKKDRKKIRL